MALIQLPVQDLLRENQTHCCDGCGPAGICVKIVSIAELPTRFGDFQIVAFENDKDGKDHIAIVRGDVTDGEDIPVRLHSECLTGDALGSLRCDCRDQLEAALIAIGKMDKGIVLYLRQEGRGIGLANKIRAYSLQDAGLDTVQANLALGFRDDERDYEVAAHMLMSLKVQSIQLMTNNPRKIEDLKRYGVRVNGRIPHVLPPNPHNEFYLRTKAEKSGHMLDLKDFKGKVHLQEQDDRPVVKGMTSAQIEALHE